MEILEPGSVILVTGASGGIGFEIAAQAAEAGAVVGVHGSRPASAQGAVERLKARFPHGRFISAPADFNAPGDIVAMVAAFVSAAGRLDAVVNCAVAGAPGVVGPFLQTDPDSFGLFAQRTIGAFQLLCHSALPHLGRQGGAIVTFVSDSGLFAAPRQSLIGGVWGGVMSFARNLAMEVSRDGVRVHCISPSFVADTPVYDRVIAAGGRAEAAARRAGLGLPTPKDIAPMVLFLCGPRSVKITGQIISINGGLNV